MKGKDLRVVDFDNNNNNNNNNNNKQKKDRRSFGTFNTTATDPLKFEKNGFMSSEQKFLRASDNAFISLPTVHFDDEAAQLENGSTQNPLILSSDSGAEYFSKSSSKIITPENPSEPCLTNEFRLQQNSPHRESYHPHLTTEAVNEALEKGHIFRAAFRVNAHHRVEAYCKIDGVQTDILIGGIAAQNRAVEGDIVAIEVYPLSCWDRMKGSAETSNTTSEINKYPYGSLEVVDNSYKEENKVELFTDCVNNCKEYSSFPERGISSEIGTSTGSLESSGHDTSSLQCSYSQNFRDCSFFPDPSKVACDKNETASSVEKLCNIVNSFPLKRPTGRVVSIIERSPRRDSVVGFLNIKQCLMKNTLKKKNKKGNGLFHMNRDCVILIPNDPKFTKMVVFVKDLPSSIVKRLEKGDMTIENELVGACICGWGEGISVPHARVLRVFGRGGEIEPHIASILFENNVDVSDFSPEILSSVPSLSCDIPLVELQKRIDLRNVCIFTIDPSTATDLDDALSVQSLPNGLFRAGVHIADVSYFVLPDTALDREAQVRSTSVYLSQRKIPMLPPLLSENVGSLNPGIDKLAFSIIWDINPGGEIVNQWIGRTVIRSCCKLSYSNAQQIIDGFSSETGSPQVHSNFEWSDICRSVQCLFNISKKLKENRYKAGALCLYNARLSFLLDDDGFPYESMLPKTMESNFLVEEFMLLANKTAANVVFKAYPDSSLLRTHPEPQPRKIREFEAFCTRHGLELDTSSSTQFHRSIEGFKSKLVDDPVLFNILVNCATKCMQLAKYFSSEEIKGSLNDWRHFALGVPLYTHFTSPLRRYADIVVHRTLAATIEAEDKYSKLQKGVQKNIFTGIFFDKIAAESPQGKVALAESALRNGVPCSKILIDIAAHCNDRKLACRNVKDASDRLYMWCILKKKQILLTEARVLALGPRFMSIYIPKLAIERRIKYDESDDLVVEWLDVTSTLLLKLCPARKQSHRRGNHGNRRTLEEIALITCPLKLQLDVTEDLAEEGFKSNLGNKSEINEIEPAAFPLTVTLLSRIPVAIHAVGGDDGPLDISARLYMSTWLR